MCQAQLITRAGTIANTSYLLDLRRFAAPARAAGVMRTKDELCSITHLNYLALQI
ncbi:Uncharacterised protein [BD1-7 clade bacterium]|nr:Uncharacterised protein [BD1-7 clade bacterium]